MIKILKGVRALILTAVLGVCLASCSGPLGSVSGTYRNGNLSLIFSAFEFAENGQVTMSCAGFENAKGTYAAEGDHYLITIKTHDENSNYYDELEEIKNDCYLKVTPIDDNTIRVRIEAKEKGYIYIGQAGEVDYRKD